MARLASVHAVYLVLPTISTVIYVIHFLTDFILYLS